jgi:Ser/Thr protein kinase RdoA (MazF antagonist)
MTAGWREWPLLGVEGELLEVNTIAGGASGAAVYRITVARCAGRRDMVLKVASEPAERERASRELHFYRDLAERVPVLVPKFLAGVEHPDGIFLLLESTVAHPIQWSGDRWAVLAAELGGLHRNQPVAWPWTKAPHHATEAEIVATAEFWQALGYGPLLTTVWSTFDRLDAALTRLPICLRHGDWHLGNILLDPADRFVWIDWQEVGIGRGPEDLALLWQRAEFDGLTPPRDAMLAAYARSRGIPNDSTLRMATVAAELTMLLLSWPPHLTGTAEPARARLLRRLEQLVRAWQAGGQ